MQLGPSALRVLEEGFLRRDAGGEIVETPQGLCRRVAHCVAQAETHFGDARAAGRWEETFYDALTQLDFLPSAPILCNAGTPLGQLASCLVLPVEDTLEEIFEALKRMALGTQSGAGTGLSFSHLRARGDRLISTGGMASGPVSFLLPFAQATQAIRQGGRRRAHNLGALHVEHPDIEAFCAAKRGGAEAAEKAWDCFRLAVGVPDAFMEAAGVGGPHRLADPRTGQAVRTLPAAELLAQIAQAAWEGGDPSLLFLDACNRPNPTPALGRIEAHSPHGEAPLLAHEACVLGTLNLGRMVRRDAAGPAVDWELLERTVRLGVRFLDDALEVGRWPTSWTASMVRANRKIGLGVMGFGELLLHLRIPYATAPALSLAEALMSAIAGEAQLASQQLARERGAFPSWSHSVYARSELRLRNATRLAIAPTGSLSLLADTSPGIEPLFALAYRRDNNHKSRSELHPLFRRHVQQAGLDVERVLAALLTQGSVAEVAELPRDLREIFRTALQISPEDHLEVQAAFQRHVDNGVCKTISLRRSTTAREVGAIYRRAWELGLKSVALYRYGKKAEQVLTLGAGEEPEQYEHFLPCARGGAPT